MAREAAARVGVAAEGIGRLRRAFSRPKLLPPAHGCVSPTSATG
jgi:hypothetical protein